MDLNAIKDRLRKLLNVAKDDAASQGEIENALALARRLMDQHRLTPEELAAAEAGGGVAMPSREDIDAEAQRATMGERRARSRSTVLRLWESLLANVVERVVGTVKCYEDYAHIVKTAAGLIVRDEDGEPLKAKGFVFYGPDEDAALAVELYESLSLTIWTAARVRYGSAALGSGAAYAEGFVRGLRSAVDDAKRADAAAREHGAGALVHVSKDARLIVSLRQSAMRDRAAEWLEKERGIKLRAGSGRYGSSGSNPGAHAQGVRDGKAHGAPGVSRSKKLGA